MKALGQRDATSNGSYGPPATMQLRAWRPTLLPDVRRDSRMKTKWPDTRQLLLLRTSRRFPRSKFGSVRRLRAMTGNFRVTNSVPIGIQSQPTTKLVRHSVARNRTIVQFDVQLSSCLRAGLSAQRNSISPGQIPASFFLAAVMLCRLALANG